jgi:hypothetical protein
MSGSSVVASMALTIWRFDNRHARKLRCSVDELFSLSVAWPRGVDYDILGIARGPSEQIEYRDTVVGI